ncbi:hypothetical protein Pst134EB_028364 [Puccinia striiformis f. sp. tritici]|nr:hypothetical protein Pst134EB_028364 [Puccinia striiformis f. sp. tritici]
MEISNNLFCITAHNASNNGTLAQRVEDKLGGIFDADTCLLGCMAHVINLAAHDGLKVFGTLSEDAEKELTLSRMDFNTIHDHPDGADVNLHTVVLLIHGLATYVQHLPQRREGFEASIRLVNTRSRSGKPIKEDLILKRDVQTPAAKSTLTSQTQIQKKVVKNKSKTERLTALEANIFGEATNDSDILYYWAQHTKIYPLLSLMAHCYLGIPATSTPSEQVFSQSKTIIRSQQHSLSSASIEHLLCVKEWYQKFDEMLDSSSVEKPKSQVQTNYDSNNEEEEEEEEDSDENSEIDEELLQ